MYSHDLIITTFNSFKHLNNLYQFIYHNINKYSKIIIIDDCSNKEFYKLLISTINEFKNILILRNEKNLGPSASRNLGIKASKAEFISFHDPDDHVCNERIDIVSYYLKKFRPNVLFHDFSVNNLAKNIKNNYKFELHYGFIYLFKSLYVTPAFTCKRTILEKVGGYNENIRYAEDLDLYIRLRKLNKFLFIKQKLVRISTKKDRINDENHLSSNIFLMRKSIDNIYFSRIIPFNLSSVMFIFALVINNIKKFID